MTTGVFVQINKGSPYDVNVIFSHRYQIVQGNIVHQNGPLSDHVRWHTQLCDLDQNIHIAVLTFAASS